MSVFAPPAAHVYPSRHSIPLFFFGWAQGLGEGPICTNSSPASADRGPPPSGQEAEDNNDGYAVRVVLTFKVDDKLFLYFLDHLIRGDYCCSAAASFTPKMGIRFTHQTPI